MQLTVRGARVSVSDRDRLGHGGEADVYRAGNFALKVFHRADPKKIEKVRAFPAGLPDEVVGPVAIVFDRTGADVGYAMPIVEGGFEIRRLAERAFRDAAFATSSVTSVFQRASRVLSTLHARGVFVGDLNEGNLLVTPAVGAVSSSVRFIDADSLHFPAHPCTVAHERFLDPRLYGVDLATPDPPTHGARSLGFDADSDHYALAVLLFQSLLFVHPYGGVHRAHATLLRRAEARCSVLRADVTLPRAAVRADVLPDALHEHFARTFDGDHRAALDPSWLEVPWSRCGCGLEHARARCPACTKTVFVDASASVSQHRISRSASVISRRGRCTARRVLDARGPTLAVAVQRELSWVLAEGDALTREDGSRVGAPSPPAGARVAIDGRTTWIAHAGVAIGWRDGREIAHLACAGGPFGPAFDAGDRGALRVHGDHILDASGNRVASCPGGLTWLRVGASLGLAIYRAGAVARAVTVRLGDAGGRDVALPPSLFADAKVVALDAAFDDHHILVSALLERRGAPERATFLLDDRAEILAIAEGREGDGPLLGALGGCALAAGRVVAVGVEGLALYDADPSTRRFVARAQFPDSAPFVSSSDALFAAPNGDLFVVGPRSIDLVSIG